MVAVYLHACTCIFGNARVKVRSSVLESEHVHVCAVSHVQVYTQFIQVQCMHVNVNKTPCTTPPPVLVTSLAQVVDDIIRDVELFLNTLEDTADGKGTYMYMENMCIAS